MAQNDLAKLIDESTVKFLMQMLEIPGKSGDEGAVASFIVKQLKSYGIAESEIKFDTAHKKSHIGGQVGNMIVKLPGTVRGPRRLLMAHIDTVPLCVGCQPIRKGNLITSKDPATALGGDDRAGATVLLETIRLIKKHNLPHPPLTIVFIVQEEIGLVGAKNIAVSKLGKPTQCFNWDGGPANLVVIGATGDDHIEIDVEGIASHAGAQPENGVSAAAIAAKAINSIVDNGWHGLVQKGKQSGSSNIGVVQGGAATNVVMDRLHIKAEARSHNAKFRAKIVKAIQKAFEQAAKEIKNVAGKTGKITFNSRNKYESFKLNTNEPAVQTALSAMKSMDLKPIIKIANGGLDANWMNAHGLPTVTLGCGQNNIHTVKEELLVDEFLSACRLGLLIATGTV